MSARPLRYPLRSGDLVFFLHIPKTAGTTLNAVLESQFKPEQVCPFSYKKLKEQLTKLSPDEIEKYRLLCAHYDYSIYRFLPRKPVYLTMLREPIRRTVSAYEHIKRVPDHTLHAAVTGGSLSIEQFLELPDSAKRIHNRQVRQIAGAIHGMTADELAELSGKDLLSIAKVRLDEFAYFGLTERFQESMDLMAYTFDWTVAQQVKSLNVAPSEKKPESAVSAEAMAAITRCNELDIELYRYATELFDRRLRQIQDEQIGT